MPVRTVAGCVLAGIVVLYAPCVEAQELSITIANGRVTMVARDVPLQHVLSELARVGGITVLGGDKISAPPVTLVLNAVDGRVAFDILLRNARGYILAGRQDAAPGAWAIDRVLILPENIVSGRLAQSGFPSQSDPEAAFEDIVGVQTDSEGGVAVQESTLPSEVSTPQPRPESPTPNRSTRPAPHSAVPTFPVPVGFSGRPGDLIKPPAPNPYGIDTISQLPPGAVLGGAQAPR